MARADIRKLATFVDEIHQEAGRAISPPVRRAAAVAVIANPLAGQFAEDLSDLVEIGAELGGLLGARAVVALGFRRATRRATERRHWLASMVS